MQMVIDVAPDRSHAKVRGRSMMQAGLHETAEGAQRAWWEGGIYENTYKKVDGVWRIHILDYAPQWHADYETGWAHTRPNYVPFLDKTIPEDPTGPDVIKDGVWLWPTHKVVPHLRTFLLRVKWEHMKFSSFPMG